MAQDFLAYWKPSTVDRELKSGDPGNHAASNQYKRIEKRDTVWFVTVRDGKLRLITRIIVADRIGQAKAAKRLGQMPSALWKSDHHIVADEGTEIKPAETDIHKVASSLRFVSSTGRDRLTITTKGTVSAQQLQTMRRLAPASVAILAKLINGDAS